MSNLFDNPMVKAAKKAMSEEQLKKFEDIGKEMYNNIDYELGVIDGENYPRSVADSVFYITESIKSGLHPTDLPEEEKALLKEVYGKEWYERFGFVEQDLVEVYTLKTDKKIYKI